MNVDTTQSQRNLGIQETSKMMLQGWKLLATSCPICKFALMSKAGTLRCPNCMADVISESTYENKISKIDDKKIDDKFLSSSDCESGLLLTTITSDWKEKQNIISSKLGSRMMQGWTMLAQICPKDSCRGTPLMKLKGSEFMECVSCDCNYKFSGNDLLEVTNGLNLNDQKNNDDDDDDYDYDELDQMELETTVKSNSEFLNKASNEISKKLLLGWSLLSEECTRTCNGDVPLMKDLEGNVCSYFDIQIFLDSIIIIYYF